MSKFRFVDVLVWGRFGLSTIWFVDVLVCRRFVLLTFWFVDVLVCRRFGCLRFGLSTFWPVTIVMISEILCHIGTRTYIAHGFDLHCFVMIFNPLRAKFYIGRIQTYLQFIPFRHIEMIQVLEILPCVRQEFTYYIWPIWVVLSWRCKEPGHQQPW